VTTTLLDELYLPGPHEPMGVLPWGKSPELTQQDLAKVVARIGKHRTPNYGQSYLLGANTLLRTAIAARTLDHHALPIFYLQRHAAELIIKAPLQFGLDIQKYCEQLERPALNFPVSNAQRERVENCHDLGLLLDDLVTMTVAIPVGAVPDVLRSAVSAINDLEQKKATWSRYSFSRIKAPDGSRQLVNHMADECILPLGEIQNLLQEANIALGTVWPVNGLMMGNLGALWERLAREAGEFD
jgi:hypothetical protein